MNYPEQFVISENPEIVEVISLGDTMMQDRYGKQGERPLAYHCEIHSRDVAEDAMAMMAYAGRSQRLIGLMGIAGTYHDIEHSLSNGDNERASADVAVREMDKIGGFSLEEKGLVYYGILATITKVDSNGKVSQSPRLHVFTDEVVADADLAHLGKPTDIFLAAGDRLFKERYPGSPLNGPEYAAFDKFQLDFIRGHRFYTLQADLLFPTVNQRANICAIKQRIADRTINPG
ncbi:MAG: hypothetical protein ABI220_04585 [Candidatus Saccharimonadales bacterium]